MYKKLIALTLMLTALAAAAQDEQEFLKPDQAFAISALSEDGKSVAFDWQIADGYYMYRSKFRFISDTPGVELGDPDMPQAETKNDPVFGDVEVYRERVRIAVPLSAVPAGTDTLALRARSQGCADAGICYPPHMQTVLVALNQSDDIPPPVDPKRVEDFAPSGSATAGAETGDAVAAVAAAPATDEPAPNAGGDPLTELAALGQDLGIGIGEDDILSPEQAFQVAAYGTDGSRLQVQWTIADGTYLYQNKVKLSLEADGVQLGSYELPRPDIKKDSIKPDGSIGDVAVYHHMIDLDIPLVRSNTDATTVTLTASYQGCAERGICYPPQKQVFKIDLPAASGATTVAAASVAQPAATATTASTPAGTTQARQSEQDEIASMIAGQSTWVVVGAFFLIGLGLAFTPCVFPMIPILSGIITGHGSSITARKAFMLSLVYVLAMALTYTVAGVFAALAGENLQAMLQNPVAITIFAMVFVALAFSMFGFYDLQLPSGLQSKLTEISNKQEGGSLVGAGIMGLLSALIVGPCVAPPLAGALIYIGQTGDAVLGGLALFAMSMGMGAPLIAIGTSAGKLLPRAGAWMDTVKAVFGVVMLGVAIYLLERIISPVAAMLLWGALLVVSAIYMGAISHLPEDASGWRKLWKGVGVAMLIYGTLFFIGAAANGNDTLQPLRGVVLGGVGGGGSAAEQHVTFKRVKTVADLNAALAAARTEHKAVMLDFYADWCIYCKLMEKNTFPDPAVSEAMSKMVLLQADVTDNDDDDRALQQHIGIPAPPAMIFWGPDGAERRHLRLLGFKGPDEFAPHLTEALKQ